MNPPRMRVLPYLILLLPFDAVVSVFLLIAAVIRKFGSTAGSSRNSPPSPISSTIQILNWDGRHLLEESFPRLSPPFAKPVGIIRFWWWTMDQKMEVWRSSAKSFQMIGFSNSIVTTVLSVATIVEREQSLQTSWFF